MRVYLVATLIGSALSLRVLLNSASFFLALRSSCNPEMFVPCCILSYISIIIAWRQLEQDSVLRGVTLDGKDYDIAT